MQHLDMFEVPDAQARIARPHADDGNVEVGRCAEKKDLTAVSQLLASCAGPLLRSDDAVNCGWQERSGCGRRPGEEHRSAENMAHRITAPRAEAGSRTP